METDSSAVFASDGCSTIVHDGMACTGGGPSRTRKINTEVKLVTRLTTHEEATDKFTPPDSFVKMMRGMVGKATSRGRGTYDSQYEAIRQATYMLEDVRRLLHDHEEEGRKKLAKLNEVLRFDRVDIFTTTPELMRYYNTTLVFWLVTGYGQVLKLKIRGHLATGRTFRVAKFTGWVRCETSMCTFSPNSFLSRFEILEIFKETDPEVQDVLKKMIETPFTRDGERCFFTNGEDDNTIALSLFPEDHDSIETENKKSAKWVAEHAEDILDYVWDDAAMSFIVCLSLANLYRVSPAEAEVVAKDRIKLLKLCLSFRHTYVKHGGHVDMCVIEAENVINTPIIIYSREGKILYMRDMRRYPLSYKIPIALVSVCGRYYLSKTVMPSFAKAYMESLPLLKTQLPLMKMPKSADQEKLALLQWYIRSPLGSHLLPQFAFDG